MPNHTVLPDSHKLDLIHLSAEAGSSNSRKNRRSGGSPVLTEAGRSPNMLCVRGGVDADTPQSASEHGRGYRICWFASVSLLGLDLTSAET